MFDWLKTRSARTVPPAPVRPAAPIAPTPAPAADLPLQPAPRETRGISYNPDLIRQYHEDHRQLLGLFARAKQAAEAGHWPEVETTLTTFRTALTDHLLSESIRLYTYLKQQIAGDPDSMDMMKSFSSEMNSIGRVVMSFLDGQKDLGRSPAKQGAFLPVWTEIGRTLGDRIAREEKTLYPMYQDSH